MTLIDNQIAELDEIAIDYYTQMADPKFSEGMRTYWNNIGQSWMFLLGLRKAQLVSLRRYSGLVLVV